MKLKINGRDEGGTNANLSKEVTLFAEDGAEESRVVEQVGIFKRFCDFVVKYESSDELSSRVKFPLRISILVILIFFGVGGAWSLLAPLDGAVIANGKVELFSKTQMVQHLEGGVIEKIVVREGDKVEKEQPLIYLRNIEKESQLAILHEKMLVLQATKARLVAEQKGLKILDFGDFSNLHVDEARRSAILEDQAGLFEVRRMLIEGQIGVLENRIEQGQNEIDGINAQCEALAVQERLTQEELKDKQQLLKSGGVSKPQVMALEKQYAVLIGKKGEYKAMIAQIKQKISEAKLEMVNLRNKFYNDVADEVKGVNVEIVDSEERIKSVTDILSRITVRAPQNGVVNKLRYNTEGGVVSPGSVILELVPVEDAMIVDVLIEPSDIESVLAARQRADLLWANNGGEKGIKVKVRITAYNSRKVGLVEGILTYVSADVVVDERAQRSFYSAKVLIPEESLIDVNNEGIYLYPGMPVVVYITTESRTPFSYLFAPLMYSFMNAFRER